MPTLTTCPSCSKQLKVPDELIGRQVKCPACATTFTATAGAAPADVPFPAPAAPRPEFSPSAPGREFDPGRYDEPRAPRPAGSNPLFGPGIAMLISAILNLLAGGYLVVNGAVTMGNPDFAAKNAEMGMKFMKGGQELTPEEQQQAKDQVKVQGPAMLIFGVLGVLFSILTVVGSIMMMKGRGGALPWMGAIVSVIPCTAPCCCTGIPIGIWSMMALNKVGKG